MKETRGKPRLQGVAPIRAGDGNISGLYVKDAGADVPYPIQVLGELKNRARSRAQQMLRKPAVARKCSTSFKGCDALKRKINPTRAPIEQKESMRCLDNLRLSIELAGATKNLA